MSWESDYSRESAGGMTKEAYVRCIWKETRIEADDFESVELDEVDDVLDKVREVVTRQVGGEERLNLYLARLNEVEDDMATIDAWFAGLESGSASSDSDKRLLLKEFFTNVLRGSQCSSHVDAQTATQRMTERRYDPWETAFQLLTH